MRKEWEINRAIERYADSVRRICMIHLKNYADCEDIFQAVFLKYALSSVAFASDEHEKAWLLRVAINCCRDLRRSFFKSHCVSLEEIAEPAVTMDAPHRDALEAVITLPQKYRQVIYLYYYEGYTAPQIGKILGKNVHTVYTHLNRAKELLREKLGGEEDEE